MDKIIEFMVGYNLALAEMHEVATWEDAFANIQAQVIEAYKRDEMFDFSTSLTAYNILEHFQKTENQRMKTMTQENDFEEELEKMEKEALWDFVTNGNMLQQANIILRECERLGTEVDTTKIKKAIKIIIEETNTTVPLSPEVPHYYEEE